MIYSYCVQYILHLTNIHIIVIVLFMKTTYKYKYFNIKNDIYYLYDNSFFIPYKISFPQELLHILHIVYFLQFFETSQNIMWSSGLKLQPHISEHVDLNSTYEQPWVFWELWHLVCCQKRIKDNNMKILIILYLINLLLFFFIDRLDMLGVLRKIFNKYFNFVILVL